MVVTPVLQTARTHELDEQLRHQIARIRWQIADDPDDVRGAIEVLERLAEGYAREQVADPTVETLLSARTVDEMPATARWFRIVQTRSGKVCEEFWWDRRWRRTGGSIEWFRHLIDSGWRVPQSFLSDQFGVPAEVGSLDSCSATDAIAELTRRLTRFEVLVETKTVAEASLPRRAAKSTYRLPLRSARGAVRARGEVR